MDTDPVTPLQGFLKQVLSRVAELLYATVRPIDGSTRIEVAFLNDPKVVSHSTRNSTEGAATWLALVQLLQAVVLPPCQVIGGVSLFQLAHLEQVVKLSDERAHFVVLDFGNDRNLWLGYGDQKLQGEIFEAFSKIIGRETGGEQRNLH